MKERKGGGREEEFSGQEEIKWKKEKGREKRKQ